LTAVEPLVRGLSPYLSRMAVSVSKTTRRGISLP